MTRILLSLLAFCSSVAAMAQINGAGYYRVKNVKTGRHIVMIDNKSTGFNAQKTTYDIDALITLSPFSALIGDPSSVIYIENRGGNQYNLGAQGTDAYATVGRLLTITQLTTSKGDICYMASATEQGITLYLFDEDWDGNEGRITTAKTGPDATLRCWYIEPISATTDNYFGVAPEVTADGVGYTSLFASFAFDFASSGMKAYVVTKVDGDLAVYNELQGTVPAKNPVIIACAGNQTTNNRLNLVESNANPMVSNLLRGVYFQNTNISTINDGSNGANPSYHLNVTPYDPETMRLLGTTADGKLAFVKSNVKYIPANRAYLTVPAGSPDVIKLVTPTEYEQEVARDVVTVTARSYTRFYGDENPQFEYDVEGTLKGEPVLNCAATAASPVGEYPIVVSQGTVTNRTFHTVGGLLTITKAPLTASVGDYSREEGEANPKFRVNYDGFRNGDNVSSLTVAPVATTEADENSGAGDYTITVQGGEAHDYEFTYVDGTLHVTARNTIQALTLTTPADVYTIDGRLVRRQATTLQGLLRGLYIVGGRKQVIQ